jgi:myosin-5
VLTASESLLLSVAPQVLGRMKHAMVEHSSSASHSFLLDDDSTLPFAANDILAPMDDKVRGVHVLVLGLRR